MPEMKFDEIRGYLKKERNNPNRYSKNRCEALLERSENEHGNKAAREIVDEFSMKRPKKNIGIGITFDGDGKVI